MATDELFCMSELGIGNNEKIKIALHIAVAQHIYISPKAVHVD